MKKKFKEYFETKISATSYHQLEKDKGIGLERLYKELAELVEFQQVLVGSEEQKV